MALLTSDKLITYQLYYYQIQSMVMLRQFYKMFVGFLIKIRGPKL